MWTGLVRLMIGTGSSEFGIKPSGYIKFWETIQCPNNLQTPVCCSAP
jgi:hypothetical protein